jgi:hypothetical protein
MTLWGAALVDAHRSKDRDLAFGEFDLHYACSETGLRPVKLAKKMPKLGETLYHGGYPYGIKTFTPVTVTLIKKMNPMKDTYGEDVVGVDTMYIVISNGVGPGSSGGGVFDKHGRLVSVISIGEGKPPGRSFTVPVVPWKE